ncbi:hypothetical protein [Amycolatopsis arida]|uniref:hypothetical protein n=1 Tax=Amycolatopsis arida TaxID=587909 RepID=UPI00312CAAE0
MTAAPVEKPTPGREPTPTRGAAPTEDRTPDRVGPAAGDAAPGGGAVGGRSGRSARGRAPRGFGLLARGVGRPAGVRARRTRLLVALTVVTVLGAGAATWFGIEAAALRAGDPERNAAVVDAAATEEVSAQVAAAVKAVFSYDYANLARTERAAAAVLVDRAVEQYREHFAAARERAERERLTRSTTVRAIGVTELRGPEARLLVFLDQQTVREGDDTVETSTGHLDIVARHVDGQWKIAALTAL